MVLTVCNVVVLCSFISSKIHSRYARVQIRSEQKSVYIADICWTHPSLSMNHLHILHIQPVDGTFRPPRLMTLVHKSCRIQTAVGLGRELVIRFWIYYKTPVAHLGIVGVRTAMELYLAVRKSNIQAISSNFCDNIEPEIVTKHCDKKTTLAECIFVQAGVRSLGKKSWVFVPVPP